MSSQLQEDRVVNDSPSVITLTLSPAWDLTISASEVELGTSHRVPAAAGRIGGKGINVARVLAELGQGVSVQGPVAPEDWPAEQRPEGSGAPETSGASRGTGAERLVWDLTPTPTRLRRSYAIVEETGRATLFNEQAPAHPAEVWAEVEETLSAGLAEAQVRVLAISGSTPADLPAGFYDRVIATAHACDVQVIVDTSGPALLTAARAGADWVKPNHEELAELFAHDEGAASAGGVTSEGGATSTGDLIECGARALLDEGAGRVLASLGSAGMMLIDDSGVRMSARLAASLRGNPTGAGDASVAALARQLCRQRDDAALLTDAVAISASAVLMPQAGQIHPDWRDLRDQVVLTPPVRARRTDTPDVIDRPESTSTEWGE